MKDNKNNKNHEKEGMHITSIGPLENHLEKKAKQFHSHKKIKKMMKKKKIKSFHMSIPNDWIVEEGNIKKIKIPEEIMRRIDELLEEV
ncbi:MAG: hypothetical protein ACFFCI_00995 [Promethearchaeota archaeon]